MRRSVDGIIWSRQPQPSLLNKQAMNTALPGHRSIKPLKSRHTVNKKLAKSSNSFQIIIFTLICIALGVASHNLTAGQWAVGVYGALSLIFRVKSQTTFMLALAALVTVPLLQVMHNQSLSDNFAVYAYLLLVVGVVTALLEQWRERKMAD